MERYNGNYQQEFNDPEYEKTFKNMLNVVKALADNFFKQSLDFGIIKISPQQICYEPNGMLISKAIQDAFSDIKRIKDYHTEVKNPEMSKYASYIGYWLSRRKPFNLNTEICDAFFNSLQSDEQKKVLLDFCYSINEVFIAEVMMAMIFHRDVESEVISTSDRCLKMREVKNVGTTPINTIIEVLQYYLSYRSHGAQELELFLTGLLVCPIQMIKIRRAKKT